MALSAFGVEHPGIEISKKAKPQPVRAGRVVTGAFFPGWHGAIAGKPGHKLRAVGYELGGGMVGGMVGLPPLGAAVGTALAHDAGHYKRQKR